MQIRTYTCYMYIRLYAKPILKICSVRTLNIWKYPIQVCAIQFHDNDYQHYSMHSIQILTPVPSILKSGQGVADTILL